jgi:hypothetical protein
LGISFDTEINFLIILSNEGKSGLSSSFRSSAFFLRDACFDFGSVVEISMVRPVGLVPLRSIRRLVLFKLDLQADQRTAQRLLLERKFCAREVSGCPPARAGTSRDKPGNTFPAPAETEKAKPSIRFRRFVAACIRFCIAA